MRPSPFHPAHRAFTLVEILVVISIMGVAAAIVVPTMLRSGSMTSQAAARTVIADLLIAQSEAVAAQKIRRVMFEPALNRYRMADGEGVTLNKNWRSGGSGAYIVDFDDDSRFAGVRIVDANFGGESFIEFDDLGTPSSGGHVDLDAGEFRYRITIAAFTGRVTVAPLQD